jgi:hypothetical protein
VFELERELHQHHSDATEPGIKFRKRPPMRPHVAEPVRQNSDVKEVATELVEPIDANAARVESEQHGEKTYEFKGLRPTRRPPKANKYNKIQIKLNII